jgi:D-tyrosyl-tRNA(Tyr) deacylase
MRALVQRVNWAEVEVGGKTVGRIGHGLLVYVGVAATDVTADAERLAEKVAHLRIFEDEAGKLNRSVQDVGGSVLAISNFTLLADAGKGRRPAFVGAAGADRAEPLYAAFVGQLRLLGCAVECGIFGASMVIRSAAGGPVNIIMDSPPHEQATYLASESAAGKEKETS